MAYDNRNQDVSVILDGKEVYKTSMKEFVLQLHGKYGNTNRHDINPEDMTFTGENERVRVKLIAQNIYGSQEDTQPEININSMEFYVLVGLK